MITQERVRELFEYREGKLYWQKSGKGRNHKRAGHKQTNRTYWRIAVNRKRYLEHCLIFLYFHGFIPNQIDHISDKLTTEGVKSNLIDNLRPISASANIQKRPKTWGKEKYRGVYWLKSAKKWMAHTKYHGKKIHLGYFLTIESAAKAYDEFIIKHYDKFAYLNFPESREGYLLQTTIPVDN